MSDGIPPLLTLVEVATAMRISPHTVRSWVRKGRLRPVRLCRRLLFSQTRLLRFLAVASDTTFHSK